MEAVIKKTLDLAEQKGWNQRQLASKLDVEPGHVTNWKARGLPADRYKQVADLFRVSIDDLLGNGPTPIPITNNPDYPAILRVRFKLSAGASGFAVEYQHNEGTPMVFSKGWYAKKGLTPDRLFAVTVSNESMKPGLNDGDIVVVNTESTTPKDSHVFAVNYEGELVIKRLIRDAGEWWLSSDNADQRRYPRKLCGEGVFLLGEIVHKQSDVI